MLLLDVLVAGQDNPAFAAPGSNAWTDAPGANETKAMSHSATRSDESVIAIAVDDEKNELASFVKKYGAKFPVGLDRDHEIAGCWKPDNMPKVEEQIKALL